MYQTVNVLNVYMCQAINRGSSTKFEGDSPSIKDPP
jgi:hypothetical protein